jgi:hypothetical protein
VDIARQHATTPLAAGRFRVTRSWLTPPRTANLYAKEYRAVDSPATDPNGRGAYPRQLRRLEKCGASGRSGQG